jgi:F-type H+-transporting ATPase subunit a
MGKKKLLGCSFPVFILIFVLIFGLVIIGLITGPIGKNALHLPSWLIVQQPEPSLPAETIFHILGFPITNTIMTGWLTIIVLVIFFWLAMRKSRLIPGRLQAMAEFVLEWLLDLCKTVAGDRNGRRFFPVIATIFLFVITNSWLGLLPFFNAILVHTPEGSFPLFRNASTDVNLPLAIALVSFFFVVYFGFQSLGIGYLKQFFNFSGFIEGFKLIFKGKVGSGIGAIVLGFVNFFIGLIEFLSLLIRNISFTFRLFGNMTAGEILLLLIMFLIPWVVVDVFYVLEILIGLIQAFIFSGLTLVFVTMAVMPHEGEHA